MRGGLPDWDVHSERPTAPQDDAWTGAQSPIPQPGRSCLPVSVESTAPQDDAWAWAQSPIPQPGINVPAEPPPSAAVPVVSGPGAMPRPQPAPPPSTSSSSPGGPSVPAGPANSSAAAPGHPEQLAPAVRVTEPASDPARPQPHTGAPAAPRLEAHDLDLRETAFWASLPPEQKLLLLGACQCTTRQRVFLRPGDPWFRRVTCLSYITNECHPSLPPPGPPGGPSPDAEDPPGLPPGSPRDGDGAPPRSDPGPGGSDATDTSPEPGWAGAGHWGSSVATMPESPWAGYGEALSPPPPPPGASRAARIASGQVQPGRWFIVENQD